LNPIRTPQEKKTHTASEYALERLISRLVPFNESLTTPDISTKIFMSALNSFF